MKTNWLTITVALSLVGCSTKEAPDAVSSAFEPKPERVAFVQLFEWRWPDVAKECENVLGPAGYTAVQVSPAQEHIPGPSWWTRYQPVSYTIESRGGSRAEFADMVQRCSAAGVGVYADVIINHMADIGKGTGVAGSEFDEFRFPVPYGYDDFHHCGRNDDGRIENYQDLWEIQNCQIGLLADLNTGAAGVQAKIAAYINDLLSLGVAGLRVDAAKHIAHEEITAILDLVDGDPLVFQEVIDRGGEPIDAMNYVANGKVTEFKYPPMIVEAFEEGNLATLTDFETRSGWLPSEHAIAFVDNHDIQRGHAASGDIVNYKDGPRYNLAVAFMLAHSYGYPLVMSSYAFEDGDQGPPDLSPHDEAGCGLAWICEHRRPEIANMLGFRRETVGTEVVNWMVIDDTVLSFGRGEKGHIVINTGDGAASVVARTNLPRGSYTDLLSGTTKATVDAGGMLKVEVKAESALALTRNR